MRKLVVSGALALAVAAAAFTAGSANAVTPAPGGLRPAIEGINPVDHVACWRRGWHGWGWYPCGGYVAPRYYAAPPVYLAPRPYWRGRYWRRGW